MAIIQFLSPRSVLNLHELHRQTTGGIAGIRDRGLLDSAIAQPQASFGGQFLHEGLDAMAAAYLFHLVKNHPFLDGNKRIGLAVALTFLEVNGRVIDRPDPTLTDSTLGVAEGRVDKEDLTDLFGRLARPVG